MEPTVLAGPIEFSPVDIAAIIAVLAAFALLVTAPGWVVLGLVSGRRAGPGATGGRRWAARVGGGLLGVALSVGAASLVNVVTDGLLVLAVPAAWAACWGVAAVLRHRPAGAVVPAPQRVPQGSDVPQAPESEGWGR